MSTQQFADIVSPWALNDDALARLHRELADAERRAEAATLWVDRVRAEQEAKSLGRRLAAAEFEGRFARARSDAVHRRAAHVAQATAVTNALAAGQYAPVRPYFAASTATCRAERPRATTPDAVVATNMRRERPISFSELGKFVERARQAGMLKR